MKQQLILFIYFELFFDYLTGWDTYIGPDLDTIGEKLTEIPVGLNKDPRKEKGQILPLAKGKIQIQS